MTSRRRCSLEPGPSSLGYEIRPCSGRGSSRSRDAIVDHYRHHARRPTLENDDDLALGALPSATAGPDEITELRDLARSVKSGIGGLSKRDATALSLAVHFGFGPTEIGEALSISPGNAKVVLHRARKRLRDAIELPHDTEGLPYDAGCTSTATDDR
ncbi:MAG: sigma-70 family RNA polymerase sigma factor [Acidimicrobiales bacterium]